MVKKAPKRTTKKPAQKKKPSVLKNPRVQILLAILLFINTAVLVHDREMHEVELAIFRFAYSLPDFLTPVFFAITQLGNIYVFFVLAALLLVKKYYHVVVRLLMAGSIAYLLTGVGKDLIGRARPAEFASDVVYRDFIVRGSGFPSGHVALATAIGLTLAIYLPRKFQWLPVVLILGVGFSRMQLGVHGPMDIVGGFAVGWFAVEITKFVQIKLTKKPEI
jgi:undecaprenyl-diphosphatase